MTNQVNDWQPTASQSNLRLRADLYRNIREFFHHLGVMEVETPIVSQAATTDVHIASMSIQERALFLQTSPEFAMKRLLSAGSGPIYQIAKSFRLGEEGNRHNPEFTMLEWYRPGFDHHQLMEEVATLVNQALEEKKEERPVRRLTYREAFVEYLNVDPHQASVNELANLSQKHTGYSNEDDRDALLDVLMSHVIEPQLGRSELTFIYDYPASQCALAKVDHDEMGVSVAERFELYVEGVELANGYHELTDWQEQLRRFEGDLANRDKRGLPLVPIDQRLVSALQQGMPDTAGVALGLDRLLMLMGGAQSIREVIAFPTNIA